MLHSPQKRETQAGGPGSSENEKLLAGASLLPSPVPAVNTTSPRLWRALRKFNRNFKRIGRLQEKNASLLEEMRRLQGANV